jgi:hypothetical protein
MKNYLILILLLTSTNLNAQLMVSRVNTPDTQQSSLNYNERLHLNINSNFLLAGETLLFNVRCTNSFTHLYSDLSAIAYVEVINEEAKSILQTRIGLIDGQGSGDFFLPSTLRTGNYTLIAYTNWMRNFPDKDFFKTTITIINPFKKPDHQFSKSKQKTAIEFFPEGGQILAGTPNTIGFIIASNTSKNIPYSIKIVDNLGNLVTESKSSNEGSGIVNFLPLPGRVYKAIVSDTHASFIKNLPTSKEDGIGIRTVSLEKFIDVTLTYRGKENNRSATLAVQHQGNDVYKSPIIFESDSVKIKIRSNILPSGLSQIVVLNSANQVECERTIFIRPDSQKQLSIALQKKDFKQREKVSLNINLKDSLSPADLSMSVRKIDKNITKTALSDAIVDHTMSDKLIDFLCLTDRRNEKNNDPGTVNDFKNPKYIPEVRGITISGTVTNLSDAPIVNELIYLSIPSVNYLFLVSKTDSTGSFYFTTNKINSNTDVVIQLAPENKSKYRIKLKNEFLDDYQEFTPAPSLIDSSFSTLIKERSVFAQLENVYYSEKRDSVITNPGKNRFYGMPDKTYLLDNYVRFPTLDDVFIEYIPEISLRKKGEQYSIKVVNYKTGAAFNEDPLILLDGIPIFDHNEVINFSPLLIKKIEIIKRRYFYGPLDLYGIISLETYKGDGMNIPFKDYTVKQMMGIQPEKIYYQPTYDKEDFIRIPDFRIQLYWNPSLRVNSNQTNQVEFYTSDVNGDFEISIEGTDLKGNRISLRETISVNQSEN